MNLFTTRFRSRLRGLVFHAASGALSVSMLERRQRPMTIGKTARDTKLENSNLKLSIVPDTHPATWFYLNPGNEKFLSVMFCLLVQSAERIFRVDLQNNYSTRL